MSTYYTLQVSRAEAADLWKKRPLTARLTRKPALYTEITLENVVQRTDVITETTSPEWDEIFPLSCSLDTSILHVRIKHDFAKDICIGYSGTYLEQLLDEGGEVKIPLRSSENPDSKTLGFVYLDLRLSDAMENTQIALENVVRDILGVRISALEHISNDVDDLIKEGKAILKSDLSKSLKDTIPAIDAFMKSIDYLAESHPYLKLAWNVTTALYKIVTSQMQFDSRLRDLVVELAKTFRFVVEATKLGRVIDSLSSTISELLDFVTQCSLFIRAYAQHAFIDRTLRASEKAAIEDLKVKLANLRDDFKIGVLLQVANNACHNTSESLLQKIEFRLKPVNASSALAQECLEGTRKSLIKLINSWIEDTDLPNLFLLLGGAGTGKSTVARTIAEECRRNNNLGCYLPCLKGTSDPDTIIRTISYNLAAYENVIAERIDTELQRSGEILSATPKTQFDTLLLSPLRSVAKIDNLDYPILIIIDALDECGTPGTRKHLVRLFEKEFSTLPSNYRFLVTSRPEEDIVSLLPSQHHVCSTILDHESEDSKRDVLAFLTFEFERLRESGQLRVPDDWLWDDSIVSLAEAANGLFIWASTAVKFISEKKTNRFKYFRNLVGDSRSLNLDDLYMTVLEDSLDWDDYTRKIFTRVFSLIFFNKTPLSDTDIDGILYLEENATANLLACLRSLVTYEPGQPIHIHHASLYDYLTSPHCKGRDWFIDVDYHKQYIASSCIDTMGELLRFNIGDLESSYLLNEDVLDLEERIEDNIPSFLQYACCNWALHLQGIPYSVEVHKRLKAFSYSKLLFWFEVLSLTKTFKTHVGPSLISAIAWLGNKDKNLSGFLRDAYRQASEYCDAISQSTPHIYISLLALTKEESEISKYYAKNTESLIKVDYVGLKRHSACFKVINCDASDVSSVVFSPDDTKVVSGTWRKGIITWCATSGEMLVGSAEEHSDNLSSIALSPDGKYIVSGSTFGNVQIWNYTSGDLVWELPGGKDIYSVAFSPDGEYVAFGSQSGAVCIWYPKEGGSFIELAEGHNKSVRSIVFSPNGKYIASGSEDSTICVWDTSSREMICDPLRGHSDTVNSVSFSPDGKTILSGSYDGTIRTWKFLDHGDVFELYEDNCDAVFSIAFSPNSKYILSGHKDGLIRLWSNDEKTKPLRRYEGHKGTVWSISFSSDGKRFVSGSADSTIRIWDISGVSHNQFPTGHTDQISSIAVSPDGAYIASGSLDKTVCLWNTSSLRLVFRPFSKHQSTISSIAYSPDGSIVVSGSNDGIIQVWVLKGKSFSFKQRNGSVKSVVISPDGEFIASGSVFGTVSISDIPNRKAVSGPFRVHNNAVLSLAYSPDGRFIVSGSYDCTICIWDTAEKKRCLGPLKGHHGIVNSVAYSPDARHVASGSSDCSIRIWDVKSGRTICDPITGHTQSVSSVAFSPDGERIVSGSWDKTVCVWDTFNGELIFGPFEGHISRIETVSFFPDGKRIASGSWDKTIRVWNLDNDETEPAWDLREDGWVVGKSNELLIWIPTELRKTLCKQDVNAILNIPFNTKLDFRGSLLGDRWAECIVSFPRYVVTGLKHGLQEM